jgi:zinc protease
MIALLALCSEAFTLNTRAESFARKTTLPNGLTLIVSERNQLPTIHLQVLIRAGAAMDLPLLLGLANLVAELLPQGTDQRDAAQISRQIESVGGSLSASAESDYATIRLSILKKDLPLGLSILSDILLNPSFDQKEIGRKVSELKARLKRMEEDPRQVAQKAFAQKLFGPHPYANPPEGSLSTLSSITREDIVGFFQAYYRPNNVSILIVGQISLEEGSRMIQEGLKEWKPVPIHRPPPVQPTALTGPVIEKIDRPISQASIVWGHLGIARSNPDFYALQVMNYILGGGGFVSRLVDIIRDNLGLTYGISSHFDARESTGSFQIAMETKSQNTNLALSEISKVIHRFLEKGISPTELSEAKAYLTGSFPLRMDTNAKLVRLLTAVEFYALGLDFPERYPRLINQVTADEVQRVARAYLKPENFLLVVVGNQKDIQLKESW